MTGKELTGIEKIELKDAKTYKIEFDMYAVQLLEEETGGFENIFTLIDNFSMKNMSFLLWVGLLKHQPELEEMVESKRKRWFGDMVDAKDFKEVVEKVSRAFVYFFNEMKSDKKGKKN